MDRSARTTGIAVVTGGGSGIGRASALALAAEGWTVTVTGRREDPLDKTVEAASDLPGAVEAVTGDVTDPGDVDSLFAGVLERHGRLDLLFNNAGAFGASDRVDRLDVDDWDRIVAVNLTGVFLCTRVAFAIMADQRPQGGRIINNGSISAHTPRPHSAAYTSTKHAVTGLTRSTALDGRPLRIACGQIDIGNAATAMTDAMAEGVRQADGSTAAEPRMDVEDAARAVAYMAGLPLDANVLTMTVMATGMPYVGRG